MDNSYAVFQNVSWEPFQKQLQNILGNDTPVRICISSPTVNTLKGKPHLDVWVPASLLKSICPYSNAIQLQTFQKYPSN